MNLSCLSVRLAPVSLCEGKAEGTSLPELHVQSYTFTCKKKTQYCQTVTNYVGFLSKMLCFTVKNMTGKLILQFKEFEPGREC